MKLLKILNIKLFKLFKNGITKQKNIKNEIIKNIK